MAPAPAREKSCGFTGSGSAALLYGTGAYKKLTKNVYF
jgi:hypothetical protein